MKIKGYEQRLRAVEVIVDRPNDQGRGMACS